MALLMSPPIGDHLQMGPTGSTNRATLIQKAQEMKVTTFSIKAFPSWSDVEAQEAKSFLDDNGLNVGELTPFYIGRNLGSPDQALHQEALEVLRRQLQVGAIVGAHCIGFGWGKETGWPSPEIWSERTWESRVKGVIDLVKIAEEEGVDVAAHPLYYSPLGSIERYIDLLKRVASPRLKVLIDIMNLTTADMYFSNTALVNQVFDKLGLYIASFHAKDVKISGGGIGGEARSEKGNPIAHIDEAVPGTGIMDYHTALIRLGELPQNITIHVEHFDYEDTIAGQQYIRSIGREVGVQLL